MREASKTRQLCGQIFIDRYLSGKVLDIGSGPDLIVPHAQPFDLIHGDANNIASYLPAESYDCVHSSHCLEHMKDALHALLQWWRLVKPGGYLVVEVPEEDLYEQGVWPSIFNPDHKATFRLHDPTSWSPVSLNLTDLVRSLPGAEVIAAEVHDRGYNYRWKSSGLGGVHRFAMLMRRKRRGLFLRMRLSSPALESFFSKIEFYLGLPLDQTIGNAMAQIQVVVRKRLPDSGVPEQCGSDGSPDGTETIPARISTQP